MRRQPVPLPVFTQPTALAQPSEQLLRRLSVVHVSGRHQNGQQQAHTVHDDMAFTAI